MTLLRHAARLVAREPRRSLTTAIGAALASALITSVLLFGAASSGTVTRRALSDLPVDAQVVLASEANRASAVAILKADPSVRTVASFDLAHFDTAESNKAGAATQTSAGVLVGLDPGYTRATGLFALSSGSLEPGAVAISRDFASNLGVVPGDTIIVTLPGGAKVSLRVSGVVATSGADLVLGPIDPSHRAAGPNPPANVAVMNRAALETVVLPRIPAGAVASEPSNPGGSATASTGPIVTGEPGVRREIHVRLDHAELPGDPVAAQAWLDTVRRRVERQGAGTITWIDDAGASLEPLAADLAWGQVLFIFLALPGILLALALSRLAADATADSTRRHAALMRARGASRSDLWIAFLGAVVLTALAGALVGVGVGVAVAFALFGSDLVTAGAPSALLGGALIAVLFTSLLASIAALLPLRAQLASEVAVGRQELQRVRRPLWERLFLDLLALGAGLAVYAATGGPGLHPVMSAEGNPTVTLAVTSFVAPLLIWLGATLVLLRAVGWGLRHGAAPLRTMGRVLGAGAELAARSVIARASAASRAIVILALAVGFATSVLAFDATYRQQQRVDAELTLGADLKASPSAPQQSSAVARLAGPGIAAVTPFVDRVVYVGPEAQDMLAIDAATLPSVAPLSDSFFSGISAKGAMDALRARPDAILVSAETARDYSIVPGDRIRIRVPDASGALRAVDFRMAGIALEFPTAPKDAFLVANAAYLATQTQNDRISFALASSDGDLGRASLELSQRLGSGWQVTDLASTRARLANSITSVDLSNLVLLDVGFAVLIAAVGLALFLLAGLAERRRELATLVAIGAEPGQMRASIVAEAVFIGLAGSLIGLLTGGVVALTLLQILAGVFDPPAQLPAIPMAAEGAMMAAIGAAIAIALVTADRALSRLSVVGAMRER